MRQQPFPSGLFVIARSHGSDGGGLRVRLLTRDSDVEDETRSALEPVTGLHDTRLDREKSDARRVASKRAPEDVGAAASVAARHVGEPSGADGARAARDRLTGRRPRSGAEGARGVVRGGVEVRIAVEETPDAERREDAVDVGALHRALGGEDQPETARARAHQTA